MRLLLAAVSLFAAVLLQAQSTYSTDFESFSLGDVNGQQGWGHIDNSPTGGEIVASPVHSGVRALRFYTRNQDFFFVQSHLYSALLSDPAGETGSILSGGHAVADPESHFSGSFWFRTPDTPVVPTRTDGRIAELNPSSKGPDLDDPVSRYAQIRVFNNGDGRVRIEIGWYTQTSATFTTATVGFLQWGQWYRFDTLIHFVDGLDGTAPNDRFTLTIYDASGALVGTACGSTWETAWKADPTFGGGLVQRAVNGFEFRSMVVQNGVTPGYVDDFTINSFSAAALTASISGATTVCFGATTLLTANGGADVTAYEWRDAANTLVATTPAFAAGAGTYTVTVTNSLCETATSAPFTVTQLPPLDVSISGRGYVAFPGDLDNLTATATGGSGSYASFTWRNASNTVVGTGPTYAAAAGTYTVTVTDATCGTATSAAFAVIALATPTVPTASEWGLLVLALGLALMAFLRMR
jgi:hypothetical protein